MQENAKLKEENEKLNKMKSIKWSREFAWPLIEKLKEENTKLMKEQIKLLDEKESLSKTFWSKNEKLKAENEKLKELTDGIMNEPNTQHILGCNAYEKFTQAMTELNYDEKCITELKEEIEKLKANDEEAMKLSMQQNELFMSQLEEKDKEIADIKEKNEPKPHKYKVGDVIRYSTNYGYVKKFLEITGTTKTMYKVKEIQNEKRTKYYPYSQESEDFYVISKNKQLWEYLKHKNIGKKDMERGNDLLDYQFDKYSETEWAMSKYNYLN
jgi:hypothetical protein